MSRAEARLALCASSGDWAEVESFPDADRRVSAEFIRALTIGGRLPAAAHAAIAEHEAAYRSLGLSGDFSVIPVSAAGVRLRGAIIEGRLDLSGCSWREGGLPPLALEDCLFEDNFAEDAHGPQNASIDISDACLSRLSLAGSRLSHVHAHGVRIAGALELGGVAPRDAWIDPWFPDPECAALLHLAACTIEDLRSRARKPEPFDSSGLDFSQATNIAPPPAAVQANRPRSSCCWLDFSRAHVAGEVMARGVRCRTPRPRTIDEYDPANTRYALNFGHAVIDGSLDLRSAALDGGLKLALAALRGEVWLGGTLLVHGEGGGLDAQALTARGIYAVNRSRALRVYGGVSLPGARITAHFEFLNAKLDGAGDDAFVADGIQIEGDLLLTGKTLLRGRACFEGARIRGKFDCAELHVFGLQGDAISGQNLVVGGDVQLHGVFAQGCVWLYGAEFSGVFDVNASTLIGDVPQARGRSRAALIATDMRVGDSILAGHGLTAVGYISMQRSVVARDLGFVDATVRAAPLDPEHWRRCIDLGWAKVGGTLIFEDNTFDGAIRLAHAHAAILHDRQGGYAGATELVMDGFRFDSLQYADLREHNDIPENCVLTRRAWLKRMRDFQPQPYANLARALVSQGQTDAALDILMLKRDEELEQYRGAISRMKLFSRVARWPVYAASKLFRWCFGYGLKPSNAVVTLIAAFLFGWAFFSYANLRGGMIVDQLPVSSAVRGTEIGAALTATGIADDVPCGQSIRPSLYAIDVFIPLVDLRQESKCEIGEASTAGNLFRGVPIGGYLLFGEVETYRYIKAIYAFLGWLVMSLSVITFSGVLQRSDIKA